MAFLTTTIITLLVLAVSFFLLPTAFAYVLKAVFRSVGWSLKNKTKARRELILAQVRIEEEQQQSKQAASSSASSAGPEDDDWEKVDNTVPSVAGNGKPIGEDWEGIIGFFHPFW